MKKIILALVFGVLTTAMTFAQTPQKMNYQGIARATSGVPLENQSLGIRISILNGTTAEYVEAHTVTTNAFGLYTLAIGDGIPQTGNIATIDWGLGVKSIKVELDPDGGNNYIDMGTSALLSTPYALFANDIADNSITTAKLSNAAVTAAKLDNMGAVANDVLTWNGTSWVPTAVSSSGSPTGTAGGDLTGTYPNPGIADNAVTTAKINNTAVTAAKIANNAITTDKIANTSVTAAKLNQMGAANGQILKWNGTAWAPAPDNTGGSPTGTAGGDLTGTYPNPGIADNAVTTAKINNTAVTAAKIANNAVTTDKIANASVTAAKLNQMGAANGQILKWNGTAWAPAPDNTGGSPTGTAGGDLTGTYPNPGIADNAVTTAKINNTAVTAAKIANNAITTDKIANTSVTAAKLNQMGAANGQILKWNGTAWAPAPDNTGGSPTGTAGGDLTGTYPNPGIADNAVTTTKINNTAVTAAKLASNAVTTDKISNNAVTTAKIANASITAAKLNNMGAATNDVLKWNGTTWSPAPDNTGGSPTGAAGGDLTGAYPNPDIADNAVTTTKINNTAVTAAKLASNAVTTDKINNNAVTTAKIANASITAAKLNNMGAATNDVLKWNGTTWSPAPENSSDNNWSFNGNSGLDATINFIGTTDNVDVVFKRNNVQAGVIGADNTAFGAAALLNNTTGHSNTASGNNALHSNTTGSLNTAYGHNTLYSNAGGSYNAAFGNAALTFNTTGNNNTAFGNNTLSANTIGIDNTATGSNALVFNTTGNANTASGRDALFSNTTGNANTASGRSALYSNTTGFNNTALGGNALYSNTIGSANTALGGTALSSNTTGFDNTASGAGALSSNTIGTHNTASGRHALAFNTTGSSNTASGAEALYSNTTGNNNTASGRNALYYNTTGVNNTASGVSALHSNTIGFNNTVSGFEALSNNTTGHNNTALGHSALSANTTGTWNTAVGRNALSSSTGTSNTAIGVFSDVDAGVNFSTAIGEYAYATADAQVVIGSDWTLNIGGYANWSNLSDIRFKKNVQPQTHGLDFIMKLEPIIYRLDTDKLEAFSNAIRKGEKRETDPSRKAAKESILQSGFSAQQVEAVAQEIGYDFSGVKKPANENSHYSIAYAEFVVPLVKAVQEQQELIQKQQQTIENLQMELQQIKELLKDK